MANVDTELDLTELVVKHTHNSGNISYYHDFWIEHQRLAINHAIDFTKPGVYEVEVVLIGDGTNSGMDKIMLSIVFWVQVVDEGFLNHLQQGTIDEMRRPPPP
jgi:hypothetical protein